MALLDLVDLRKLVSVDQVRGSSGDSLIPSGLRGQLRRIFDSVYFGYFTCGLVVMDSLVIGLEQTRRLEDADTDCLRNMETGLVTYYVLELMAVFYAQGEKRAVKSRWVRMDCFLVLAGVTAQILMRSGMSQSMGDAALVLRLVRMLRLARTYRVLVQFHDLWMFAHGLVNATRIMVHTMVPGVIVLYVFSCVAMELIPLRMLEGDEELSEELKGSLHANFRSLPVTMLTLLQFVTLDSPSGIYRPWIEASPNLAAFFVCAILILGIVFMNLVTAVIVNDAIEGLAHDHEMQAANTERKRAVLLRSLERAFQQADVDSSGDLSREELVCINLHHKEMLRDLLGSHDLVKLFDYLDIDGNGSIRIEEFCTGIESLTTSDTRLEIKRMERVLDRLRREIHQLARRSSDGSCVPMTQMPTTPPSETDETPSASLKAVEAGVPEWAGEILGGLAELTRKMDKALLSCTEHTEKALRLQEAQALVCLAPNEAPPKEVDDGGSDYCWSQGSEEEEHWRDVQCRDIECPPAPAIADVPESPAPLLWSQGTGGSWLGRGLHPHLPVTIPHQPRRPAHDGVDVFRRQ